MTNLDFRISAGILGRQLDPDAVTFILNMEPRCAWRAGDQVESMERGESGKWEYTTYSKDGAQAVAKLASLAQSVSTCAVALRETANARDFHFSLTVISQALDDSIRLPAALLRRLRQIPAKLHISVLDAHDPTDPHWKGF